MYDLETIKKMNKVCEECHVTKKDCKCITVKATDLARSMGIEVIEVKFEE